LLRRDDSREALLRQFAPQSGVISGRSFREAADFGDRAFTRKELARRVFEDLLALAQSELHLISLLSCLLRSLGSKIGALIRSLVIQALRLNLRRFCLLLPLLRPPTPACSGIPR